MSRDDYSGEPAGPIAYMASNGVAANLCMFAILAAGLVSLSGLERESWPTVPFNHIEVYIAYPGATPEELEESVITKVEEQVNSLDDVRGVKSMASPGVASVRIEVKSGTDIPQALDEIESAVGRIQTFPVGARRPEFREMTSRQSIIRVVVYGDISEGSLKELAYQIEDGLAALPAVSLVETSGVRDYEISIEVPMNRLRALGLTLDDIAAAVRRSSVDLSAGRIETGDEQVRVRSLGQRYVQRDFEEVVVQSRSDGTIVRLGDIARVRDAFEDVDLIVRHEDKPAAFVEVSRVKGEHVMDVATAVQEHVANVIVPSLPHGVKVDILNDESQTYAERADLLLKNGGIGLLLVLVALALFLEIRLAVWVVVGPNHLLCWRSGRDAGFRYRAQHDLPVRVRARHRHHRRRRHRRGGAHSLGTHAGHTAHRRRDTWGAANQGSADVRRVDLDRGVHAGPVRARRHWRDLEGAADHDHRHAADLVIRVAADPA